MVKRIYVPAIRHEAGSQAYWSLYSVDGDCWLPVTFRSEREATEAAQVVNSALTPRHGRISLVENALETTKVSR